MLTSPTEPESADTAEAEAARQTQVLKLLSHGRFDAARDWIDSDAFAHGANPLAERMRLRALIARLDGDLAGALALLNEARVAVPEDPEVVSDLLDLLVDLRRFRQALDLIAAVDANQSESAVLRASCGHLYDRLRLPAHAYSAYRGAYKESLRKAIFRIRAGWFKALVKRTAEREEETIGAWRRWLIPSMFLSDPALDGFESSQVRANVEWLNWRRVTLHGFSSRLARFVRWTWRLLYGSFSVALALYVTSRLLMNAGVIEQIAVAVASLIVVGSTAQAIWRCHWWVARENVALATGIGVMLAVGGILAAARPYYSPSVAPWLTLLGLSLAFGSISLALTRAVLATPRWYQALRLGELRRDEPHAWILDALLDVLNGVKRDGWRTDAWDRRYYVQLIESAARGLVGDFRHEVPGLDGYSEQWIEQRSAGVAASLRSLKHELIAPSVNSTAIVTKVLRKHIIALASGNLRQLPWVPPPPPPRPLGVRGWVWRTGKLAVVAVLPVSAVIVLNLTVGVPVVAQPWLLGASVVWLVISVLFILDPQLREKLDAMNLFVAVLRKEKGENKTEDPTTIGSVK